LHRGKEEVEKGAEGRMLYYTHLDKFGGLDGGTHADGERGHVGHFHRDEPRAFLFDVLSLDGHFV
jgi:hypothetical protein